MDHDSNEQRDDSILPEEETFLAKDIMPLPCNSRHRFIEGYVHTVCALLLIPCAVALVIFPFHLGFAAHPFKMTLILNAIRYNRSSDLTLSDNTATGFAIKTTCVALFLGVFTLLMVKWASMWWWVSIRVSRDRFLQVPSSRLVRQLEIYAFMVCAGSIASFAYATYYESDAAHGSGCYLRTSGKGVLTANCSFESAACYTEGWPNFVPNSDIIFMCREAQAMRFLTLAVGLCTVGLLIVYRHQRRLRFRYTAAAQCTEFELRDQEMEESVERNS
ncbi:hypothetical protein P280DRAFT_554607 [Massarina eburnea CBS 473.64]|uniref:Uncharacterized protein n=1 Tax=Massarina eburnea CBS 473.64 TaxID=1395130 RepID=A0A6A6RKA1_9PLEO|nr:hypothetical protein P280DRAFT_554607 [Massarina eburnea CBS 473.64]